MRKGFAFFTITALFTFLFSNSLSAQLCKGSLGDPIVNITFGAGGNPGASLSAAATGYQFVTSDCPNDGSYTVRNNTVNCFNGSWLTINNDHTGDANGYFMLVNASLAPSAFYLDTVKGLCPNTTFEFAAWVINVLQQSACMGSGIQPNLTFSIEKSDGTLLQTYNTNNIPSTSSPTWQQFGFFFTTPPGVSNIVLRIINNSVGGCGNDLGLDDITFRPCGPQLISTIDGNTQNTEHICLGTAKSVSFSSTISAGFTNPSFQWQSSPHNGIWTDIAGETNTKLTQNFTQSTPVGVYDYRITAAEAGNINSVKCRVASVTVFVQVIAPPYKSAANNSPVCANNNLQLTATGGGVDYQWTGVNNFSATGSTVTIANAQQAQSGKYYVKVTDQYGCSLLDSTTAIVNPSPKATVGAGNLNICSEKSIQLICSGGGTYAWLPAETLSDATIANPIASPVITTRYIITVSNAFACTDTASVTVNVNESPTANAGPDRIIIAGTAIQLLATASGQNITYLWAPVTNIDDAAILQPTVQPPADVNYILTVTSTNGCGIATDTMHVFVFKAIYIPAAFTPNGDGVNDTWKIPALAAFPLFQLSVYNRFGQLVFLTKINNQPWDGTFNSKPLEAGAYVYVIDLKQAPGILKGTVLIIR